MQYRDPSSRSECGGESKAPADRATPSVHQPSSHPPALQRKPLTTRQASLQERPANDGKTSGRREGKRTGSPRDAHTEPHGPDRPHPAGTPALQSSACATAQAFDHKTGVPAGKASRRQEDQRITGGPVRQECGNATYPATLTVGTAGPGKGTHLLIILSLYRLIDRRCSSPPELVLAYRGRPPVGRP